MITDINSEDRLVQKTFADHLHAVLGWESNYASHREVFGPAGTFADVVIYAINWGYRLPAEMTAPTRPEIEARFTARIEQLKWKGDGYDGIRTYRSFGIFCVPDLYLPRK